MPRDTFEDRAAILPTYEWAIGHETEDPQVQKLDLERTALTTGEGFVRQQGAPQPKELKLHGWITHKAQLEAMQSYYDACQGIGTPPRTVWFKDVDGNSFEVLITEFSPQRKLGRVPGTGLNYVWQYTITMEVIS